jgi:hypothetical protein
MGTHGTFAIADADIANPPVFMQTPSNGHHQDAIVMLCDLPRFHCEKMWHQDVLANVCYDRQQELDRQRVVDYARTNGNFGNLWALGLAHTVVAYHFDRWMIYPSEYHNVTYLADYDQEPDFTVIVDPFIWKDSEQDYEVDEGYLIVVDYEEDKDRKCVVFGDHKDLDGVTVEEFIQSVNESASEEAKIDPHWSNHDGTLKGIFVPYYQRCVDETLRYAKEKVRLIIAEKAGEQNGSMG